MHESLSILNDPPKLLNGPQVLHHMIQWDVYSEAYAIDFRGKDHQRKHYKYHEIQGCVASLARRIQELLHSKVGNATQNQPHQDIIPILIPQSPGLYISQLAILVSNAAFCPINLDAPAERIKFVVGDVAAKLFITTSEYKDVVSWRNGPMVMVVDEFPTIPDRPLPFPKLPDPSSDLLAYVMYTSGSSGTPKGVTVSHLAVTQSLLAHERHIPSFKRFLQFAAPSFDVSVFEIFFPLARGCTLVGCNRAQLLNNLPGTIMDLDIDAAELTPTVVGSLLQKRANAPCLKLLLTIGEMLTSPIVEEFGGSNTQSTMLYGMYGPTEAAIHCTIYPAMNADTKPGNIGIPFDTVSTFIAKAHNPDDKEKGIELLPIGELGELVLGGPQLAHGYLNREEQNKMAFLRANGKSYYRTGDKARQLNDGTIQILGRMSAGQVKLRGQRIELGEVEEAVYKHPGIKTVTAMVLNGTLIVFALVGTEDVHPDDVRATCARWLPKFMVPREILLHLKFPYLPSGKVDKIKLQDNYRAQREIEKTSGMTLNTPVEQAVKNITHKILGPFPTNMRLGAAGLDSLMAIRVATNLRSAGFDITTIAVLQAETIKRLAQICQESTTEPAVTIRPDDNIDVTTDDVMAVLNGNAKGVQYTMPCIPLQAAMLADTIASPRAYRNWVQLEIAESIEQEQLHAAIHALAEHNSILRTGFAESASSDDFVQVIWATLEQDQIQDVNELDYNWGTANGSSLHHPVNFQLLQSNTKTKLLMHIHHALYDAWSLELLLDDFDTFLAGKIPGAHPPFANLVHGYQNGMLKSGDWSATQYWKDHLHTIEPRQLPNFHTKKSTRKGLAIEHYTTSISTNDVEAVARNLNCSCQSIFQAAYAMLLSSYLGISDICFGTVFSGRTLPIAGIEDIVGPCLATLPVRVDTSLSHDMRELILDLNATNRKHLEHSATPLRDIKSLCGTLRDGQLFDTLVIWQQTLHDFDHKRKHIIVTDTIDNLEFDLTLEIIPGMGSIQLRANYQKSIFPKSQVNLLLRQIEGIVNLIIQDPKLQLDAAFGKLENGILSIENPTPESNFKNESLAFNVEKIAAEDPERPAIDFATTIEPGNERIKRRSYAELNGHANEIAHLLMSLNVLPDNLVCICIEKSLELYTSVLATAKLGAGYLPVTPDIPSERLKYILGEAKVKVAMAHSASRHLFESVEAIQVIYVDEIDFSKFSKQNLKFTSSLEHVAYCVFTSGSTGTPKGVLVTQGNLLSNLDILEVLYPADSHTRLLQSGSQSFDVSVFEIFFTWKIGGCICSAVKDVVFRDIELAIRTLKITHLSLTPTVAALVNPDNVPKVKFLVTAGEAVTEKVFNIWADRGLYQGYGPSETTNICTMNPRITRDDFIHNIGPPFKNTSAFVLSRQSEFSLMPRGGEGEFCFGGSQVFRGYMDKSQEKGKIIEHPKYGRLYRSGDFGRLMPDGSLEFTGRKDDQVKIRGQRVELGDINNVVLRSPEVRDCFTLVHKSDDDTRLICFWVSNTDSIGTTRSIKPEAKITSDLFKMVESAIPTYMIPSSLIPINHLPLTPQGKIDRKCLIRLYRELDMEYLGQVSQVARESSQHKWTGLELEVAKAVARITKLPADQVGPDTSLFALGIDSISAISLSRILRTEIKCQVEISQILKNPSVARLAEVLSSTSSSTVKDRTASDETDFGFEKDFLQETKDNFARAGSQIQAILPCTPLQEAMLSAGILSSSCLYRNEVVLTLKGDLAKIKRCWQEMVRRHEILRTCFVATDLPQNPFVQVVLESYNLDFDSALPAPDDKSIGHKVSVDPPYSITVKHSAESPSLHILMHHALYDGVALGILYEEVEKLYHDQELPNPSISFGPFLRALTSTTLENSDKFWSLALKGFSPSRSFGKNSQRSNSPYMQSIKLHFSLSWLEDRIKRNSTSLLAVCHTIWAALLSERSKESDITFGSVVSGRTILVEGIERLVAPCFNTIPARLKNVHKLSYLEAFRDLQATSVDSLPFQLTPLRRIQSKLSPDGARLFDSLFILQQPSRELDSSIWELVEDSGIMDFPVVCEVVPKRSDNTLEIIIHSNDSILAAAEAVETLKAFEERLQESLTNSRRQILSSALKEQIVIRSAENANSQPHTNQVSSNSAPLDEYEKSIREVLADFTGISAANITRDVSIFRLGLDSISAVQVASRLRRLGHEVMASDILEHPTIAKLAPHLSKSKKNAYVTQNFDFDAFDKSHRDKICGENDIPPSTIDAVRPCTAIQRGMIAQSLHSNGGEYVNSMLMELDSWVSIFKIKSAWTEVCKIHEMLRTGFITTDDPQHPFIMITYSNDAFTPSFYDGEDGIDLLMQDIQRPWFVSFKHDGERTMMKFTAHHALYDAQSIQMIFDDVAKACNSKQLSGRPPMALLLGAILSSSEQDVDAKRRFWEREENKIIVNKFPDLTPLQVFRRTTAVQDIISQHFTADLEEICKRNGVTMQAAGQAAWGRLIAAYTGETSTTFGMTLSGRSIHEDADQTSFPSIVTLPVRCDISGTNAELLARTMKSNGQLHKHQFTPLTSIQKWAGYLEGKIFDTLFAYQKVPISGDSINFPWKVVKDEASVDYAVSLEVQPLNSGGLNFRLTFREDLIPVKHAQILLSQYDALLLDTLENPENACDVAPKFSADILSIIPAKEPELPTEVTLLHHFLERGARQWPDKIALEFATNLDENRFQSETWTYAEVDRKANMIAQLIVQRDVDPGEIVAICFDKCPEASFAIIGILKAGCAYVALDPGAPIDRVKFVIKDSGAKLVLTAGNPAQILSHDLEEDVIKLDTPGIYDIYGSDVPQLSRKIGPEDLSYCLYTSGTTGTPKGCLITHSNAVQAMLSFQLLFANHWTSTSKWLQFASFHFDVSVLEQFWSWSVGICVASAPRDLIFEDIPGAIQRLGITHIDLTPSLARLLHPDDVPGLCKGVFITGGEQLRQDILDVWGEKLCIYNGYGPTEVTIGCTMYPRVPRNGKPSNIGPQFQNVGSFVLKPGTEIPVLRGGIGELCVSGKLVGKGYLNRPELTAERFPTLKEFNERVYRTGDLVRSLHDETFIFLGRADDQVKLRGQRLELTEINEVVKQAISDLQDVVTLVLKHSAQQKEQLVTFFVASSNSDSRDPGRIIHQMRRACKSRLPGYMVPTHFIPIPRLPLNVNNKVDSKQCAAIYNDMSVSEVQKLSQEGSQDHAWSSNEKKVVQIIAEAMRIDTSAITRSSNIFELGLDSISIIGFSRALQRSGLENVRLLTVKNNPNIGALVSAISSGGKADQQKENAYISAKQQIAAFSQKHMVAICQEWDVEAQSIECVAPCTPVQEGMIYRFLENDGPLYFNKFAFRLEDDVDVDELLLAWRRVVKHTQILRTSFVATDDGFAQVVLRDVDFTWVETDYATINKAEALKKPYSIALDESLEARVLGIRMFHGLYDAISLNILLEKILEELVGVSDINYGRSFQSALPYGPLAKDPDSRNFWTKHLKEWSSQPLPLTTESDQNVMAKRSINQLIGFETLRKSLKTTPQAVIQAAWLSVLQTLGTGTRTIGLVTSGRAIDFENAEHVIGPLFNTVPFYNDVSAAETYKDLIDTCHEFNIQMQDYQHTALKDVQKWSPAKPGELLFQSLFVFQRDVTKHLANRVWMEIEDEKVIADYPLAFEATMNAGCDVLGLVVVAQGGIISQEKAMELLIMVEKAVKQIIESGGKAAVPRCGSLQPAVANESKRPSRNLGKEKQPITAGFIWDDQAKIIRSEIAQLAEVPEESVHEGSSIFELGLDSIDVIKLSSRLKKRGINIPVSSIIKSQNIASITLHISTETQNSPNSTGKLVQNLSRRLEENLRAAGKLPDAVAVLPATPLQQSMVSEMIRSDYKRYFNIDALQLHIGVDMERLMAAISKVVDISPILRASFVQIEDPDLPVSYAQVIPKQAILAHYYHSLQGNESLEDFMPRLDRECIHHAKNSAQLFQIHFVKSGGEQYFMMAAAHALYDGTSMRLLHEDIKSAYNNELLPRADFNLFLEKAIRSTTDEAKKFWRTTLSNLPSLAFPLKEPLPADDLVHRLTRRSVVPLKSVESLRKSSRVTLQTIGQTTWSLVLAYLTQQLDVLFGSVLSCRDTEAASHVQFPLMNTVAVRSILHGSLSDMLSYMQNQSDTSRQFQHFPLATAQAYALASRKGHSDASTRLFDTLFIYQGKRQSGGDALYESVGGSSYVEFLVCIELEIVDDEVVWTTACKGIARDKKEAGTILQMMDEVLQKMVEDEDAPTIVADATGISISGLPRFAMPQSKPKQAVLKSDPAEEDWSETELKVRKALHDLSDVPEDDISRNSTIFHLGLDSILILKLPALLRNAGITLSVSDILRQQTVQGMARLISNNEPASEKIVDVEKVIADAVLEVAAGGGRELKDLESEIGEIEYIMPITAGQLFLIRHWQASHGTLFYPTFSYNISENFHQLRLENAWKALVKRHPILRTGFLEIGDKVIQVIFKNPTKQIPSNDLRIPPLSLAVEKGEGETILRIKIHHALYDGISLPLLIDDLQSLYLGKDLLPPQSSFKAFIARSLYSSATIKEKWINYLAGVQSSAPTQLDYLNNKRTEIYDPSLPMSSLKSQAKDLGVSVDSLLLSSIARQYAKHLKFHSSSNLVLGIYLANRAPFGEDLSSLMAPMINFLPILIREPARDIEDVAAEIQRDLTRITDKDMVTASLEEIYAWTGVKVGIFVNILKSSPQITRDGEKEVLTTIADLDGFSREMDVIPDPEFAIVKNKERIEAYPQTIDIELRYHESVADKEARMSVGLFAPKSMMGVEVGGHFIKDLIEGLS